jgi:plasmid replication initiation protein
MQQVQVLNNNDKNHLVVKSNDFIDAKYSLTIHQSYFLAFMISLIKIDDEDFYDYTMPLNELLDFMDIERKNWKKLERTLDQLQVKQIILSNTDKVIEKVTFLSYFKIDREEDTVLFRFDKTMKPLLLNLKSKFTQVDLKGILNFESSYTIRFYEIIKKYIGFQSNQKDKNYSFTYKLEELKEIMVGDYDSKLGKIVYPKSYKIYNRFKEKVLLVGQKELKEKANFYFEFEEQKTKRAVSHIKFTVIFKPKNQKKDIENNTKNCIDDKNIDDLKHENFKHVDFKLIDNIREEYLDKPFFRPYHMRNIEGYTHYMPEMTLSIKEVESSKKPLVWNDYTDEALTKEDINAVIKFINSNLSVLGDVEPKINEYKDLFVDIKVNGTYGTENIKFQIQQIGEKNNKYEVLLVNKDNYFSCRVSNVQELIESFFKNNFVIEGKILKENPKTAKTSSLHLAI